MNNEKKISPMGKAGANTERNIIRWKKSLKMI